MVSNAKVPEFPIENRFYLLHGQELASSNCGKISVTNEAGCWDSLVGIASRISLDGGLKVPESRVVAIVMGGNAFVTFQSRSLRSGLGEYDCRNNSSLRPRRAP